MPDPIPLAQDLELLSSRYISILQASHGDLRSKDFQILYPQQPTSYTPTGGLSSCQALKQNRTSVLLCLQTLMQTTEEVGDEREDEI